MCHTYCSNFGIRNMRARLIIILLTVFAFLSGYSHGVSHSFSTLKCNKGFELNIHQPLPLDWSQFSCHLYNGEDNDENEDQDENSSKNRQPHSEKLINTHAFPQRTALIDVLERIQLDNNTYSFLSIQRYLLLGVLRI